MQPSLPWLDSDAPFPPVDTAWGANSPAPGLLAAGADLSLPRLLQAYRHGIFPWFSQGQPILWWSTDPRMVLRTSEFKVRRSFAKVLRRSILDPTYEVRIDSAFHEVIRRCANSQRKGQSGTWIDTSIAHAYGKLHHAGYAHSVEIWRNQTLVGGLYCTAIGRAVFGESMFALETDASKIALAALVALCRMQGVAWVDCQQNTRHLASMGAKEIGRKEFTVEVAKSSALAPLDWSWNPLYWDAIGPSLMRST